ncbi:MAG: hypothetical protein U1E14_05675 [Geminicoccaceae bacterium]
MAAAERRHGLPRGLLQAVALSERPAAGTRPRSAARPGHGPSPRPTDSLYAADKTAAIEAPPRVPGAPGRRNIDVGCVQVNLKHHPDAFASLDDALDPATNADYGARFLASLRADTRSWARAIERYHSADPVRGRDYRERVYANWRNVRLGRAGTSTAAPAAVPAKARDEAAVVADRAPQHGPSLFAPAGPRWRLAPVRWGQSLWSNRPGGPLLLRVPRARS